jgi:hypothetical protein
MSEQKKSELTQRQRFIIKRPFCLLSKRLLSKAACSSQPSPRRPHDPHPRSLYPS